MNNPTLRNLKAELWRRFGNREYPAEWDGRVYGGGKLSQRFWEYFKGVELLDPSPESVVLDIGGGSPVTGAGFFSSLLASAVKKVLILDPNVAADAKPAANIEYIRRNGDYSVLKEIFTARPEITHVASISVFEHIDPATREGMIRALNESFSGDTFVATLEYHPINTFFEHQLTARTVSDLFSPLTRFFLDEYTASPVWCENAFDRGNMLRINRKQPLARTNFSAANVPLWYPVAARFIRA